MAMRSSALRARALSARLTAPSRVVRLTLGRAGLPRSIARAPQRDFATANAPGKESTPPADDVMQNAANKAMRFVYMRTLPLVSQPELATIPASELVQDIERATARLCQKHADRIVDTRAAVHLHTTALAIASYRVLAPHIKNELRLMNMIRAAFGAELLPTGGENGAEENAKLAQRRPGFWIVRAALWFSWDRMAAVRRMGVNMEKDFGASFAVRAQDGRNGAGQVQHSVVVKKCFYDSLCRAEGLPHLTHVFCALDKAIFSPITPSSHGIQFSLAETLADKKSGEGLEEEPGQCNFVFTQVGRSTEAKN